MAVDMFLELDGIKGESRDNTYKDQIDILAWSWGMSQTGTFHTGSGGGTGKASFQDLSCTKYVDRSSSVLQKKLSAGEHIPKGRLIVRKAGGKAIEYYIVELTEIMVTSVSYGCSGGEERMTENVTLNFSQFITKYKPQKEDGSADAELVFGWNIAKNVEAG